MVHTEIDILCLNYLQKQPIRLFPRTSISENSTLLYVVKFKKQTNLKKLGVLSRCNTSQRFETIFSAGNFLENRIRHAYPTWRSISSGELCLFTCKYKHLCITFQELCRCSELKEFPISLFWEIMRRRWSN